MDLYNKESEIGAHLDLHSPQSCHQDKFVAVIEHDKSYGNKILCNILTSSLKSNAGVCLLSLLRPLSHHQHVSAKLGVNLKQAVDSGQVTVIDMVCATRDAMLGTQQDSPRNKTFVRWLMDLTTSALQNAFKKHRSCVFIVDDISVLLSLHVPLADVLIYLHYLKTLVSTADSVCSLVILSHFTSSDEENVRLTGAIRHASSHIINITETNCFISENLF